jgi:ubiquinone/menaquinone biosynthesis C-methylase UbiE
MRPEDRITSYYDQVMYRSLAVDAYEGSDFQNLGYWGPGTQSLPQACEGLVEKLLEMIPVKTGSILDVACGKGASTRQLLRSYSSDRVTAVNLSLKQLQTGRKNAPGCEFLAMDAAKLAFADASFDNILCVEAACHFITREDFLRECHRILKPGGRVVFSDLLLSFWMEKWAPGRRGANFVLDPVSYSKLCRDAGFSICETLDTTDECWVSYLRFYMRFLTQKYRSQAITRRMYRSIMLYALIMIFGTRFYVCGWAQKD